MQEDIKYDSDDFGLEINELDSYKKFISEKSHIIQRVNEFLGGGVA